MGANCASASASVTLVPLPPKSHSATTPWGGRLPAARRPASAATESGTTAAEASPGLLRRAVCRAATTEGAQCAGTAMVMGLPPPTVCVIASSASASTWSPRCEEPSEATSGTGSPTRSTKPPSTRPGWFRLGFSLGTPTSGARSLNRVSTDRRVTGGRPSRAATRLVIPTDNPSESLTRFPRRLGSRMSVRWFARKRRSRECSPPCRQSPTLMGGNPVEPESP